MQIITIAGNVGKDAVLRTTQSGDHILGFSVAVDNGKDRNGQRRDSTWFDVSIWGKRGEALAPYITKGVKITVMGRPTVRVHEGKAYLGVSANEVTMQGGGSSDRGSDSGYRHDDPARQAPPAGGYGSGGRPGDDLDDEIPFAPEVRV